jgi:hypothetical protein
MARNKENKPHGAGVVSRPKKLDQTEKTYTQDAKPKGKAISLAGGVFRSGRFERGE